MGRITGAGGNLSPGATLSAAVRRSNDVEIIEHADVIITLGDAELYNGPEADRQRVTNELGDLTVQLFEKNNYLDEGTVIFAKEENSLDVKEEETKKYDMELKKRLSVGK